MGLGKAFTRSALQKRSTQITATDTVSGVSQTFFIQDNIAPQWATASGYQGGMGIPGAWRAANLLAGLLSQITFDAFTDYNSEFETQITPRPPLLEQPAPPRTRKSTLSSLFLDYLWHGNGFGVIATRNFAGVPTSIVPVAAINVAVRRVTGGDISPFPVGAIEYSVGDLRFSSDQVLHLMGPCAPGEVRGTGVLESQWETLTLARDTQRQAGKIANHGVPTGILQSDDPDLGDDEAAALKARWMASQAGGGIAVLNGNTTFQPLAWDPEKLQLVEARKMSLGEIELVFGLPVGWLGGSTSSRQYSNIEQDAINLLKFTLGDHVAQFEQTLSLLYPRGTQVHGNLDFLLRSDTLSRYQAYAIGLDKKFLKVNEVRKKEHQPPIPEDELQQQLPPMQAQSTVGDPQQALPGPGQRPPIDAQEG
jgi:HK97 family phage portal protein